jgi:hypothetical protein
MNSKGTGLVNLTNSAAVDLQLTNPEVRAEMSKHYDSVPVLL